MTPLKTPVWIDQARYAFRAYRQAPLTWTRRVWLGKDPYWRQYFWNRWGILADHLQKASDQPSLWFDAQALGEVNQLRGLLPALHKKFRGWRMVVSTDEPGSFRGALELTEGVFDNPWDLSGPTRRVLEQLKPKALLVVEHPKNPIRLMEAQRQGIPTLLISGFFAPGWDQMPFMRRSLKWQVFKHLTRIAVKDDADRQQMVEHGADPCRIDVVGDLKYDLDSIRGKADLAPDLAEHFKIEPNQKILVAGSLHLNEVAWVLQAWRNSPSLKRQIQLVVVPRWPEQSEAICAKIKDLGSDYVLRSSHAGPLPPKAVLVVDRYGELPAWYRIAWAVFLGGSALPTSSEWAGLCHSPVEALAFGKPTFIGPNCSLRSSVCTRLFSLWGPLQVTTPESLSDGLIKLETSPEQYARLTEKILEWSEQDKNVVNRYVSWIEEALEGVRSE